MTQGGWRSWTTQAARLRVESWDMPTTAAQVDREFLTRTPIFAGLPARVIELIAGSMRIVSVVPGEQLLREGDPARSMFVVYEGELEIFKQGTGGVEHKLAILTPGDCVGEMSLIDIQPRSATARACGAATLYVLDLSEIAKLYRSDVEAYALLVLNISREISRRLRCADELLVSKGITADALWSDVAEASSRAPTLVVSEPS